jgi:cytochrome bd-type quinol oxidase subunit 2
MAYGRPGIFASIRDRLRLIIGQCLLCIYAAYSHLCYLSRELHQTQLTISAQITRNQAKSNLIMVCFLWVAMWLVAWGLNLGTMQGHFCHKHNIFRLFIYWVFPAIAVALPLLCFWKENRAFLLRFGITMLVVACTAVALGLGRVLPCASALHQTSSLEARGQ